jgi:hypothetical protein
MVGEKTVLDHQENEDNKKYTLTCQADITNNEIKLSYDYTGKGKKDKIKNIPLYIFCDLINKTYVGKKVLSTDNIRDLCNTYMSFIRDKVEGLTFNYNVLVDKATISWTKIKAGI